MSHTPCILAAVFAAAGLATAALAGTREARQPDEGRERYVAAGCWQCHGYEGQGGAGPRIGPRPLPLPAFTALLRRPVSDMPPYSARVLPDEDVLLIHRFLTNRPPPADLAEVQRRAESRPAVP